MTIDDYQERQFNVRAAVPEHPEVFQRWRLWSDAYRTAPLEKRLDLAYGDGPAETMDVYYPAVRPAGPMPAAILIHGGYWQAMDKADVAFAARGLNEQGIAVAAVNHTLCPVESLAGIVDEIRRACLWVWDNAEWLDIDRNRLAVVGHSAGGHLAAMMACADWPAMNPEAPTTMFRGCLAISGLFDLLPLVHTTINDKVGLSTEAATELSPVHHRPASAATAVVAPVGGDESEGFHDQAARLQAAWQPFGVEVGRMSVPGCNHFQVFETVAYRGSKVCATVTGWLASS